MQEVSSGNVLFFVMDTDGQTSSVFKQNTKIAAKGKKIAGPTEYILDTREKLLRRSDVAFVGQISKKVYTICTPF